jgi:hypothetical chaperone protein
MSKKRVKNSDKTANGRLREVLNVPTPVTAIYFTGGSVGIRELRRYFHEAFPASRMVVEDHFASVARGFGVSALQS